MSAPLAHGARAARPLATVALVVALAGCGKDELTLSDVYGTYVTLSPSSVAPRLETDTLWFRNGAPFDGPPNEGIRKLTSLERRAAAPPGSTPDSLVTTMTFFRFGVDDDEVTVTYVCPPGADCLPGPQFRGPLNGDVLVLRPRPEMSISAQTYLRVARP